MNKVLSVIWFNFITCICFADTDPDYVKIRCEIESPTMVAALSDAEIERRGLLFGHSLIIEYHSKSTKANVKLLDVNRELVRTFNEQDVSIQARSKRQIKSEFHRLGGQDMFARFSFNNDEKNGSGKWQKNADELLDLDCEIIIDQRRFKTPGYQ